MNRQSNKYASAMRYDPDNLTDWQFPQETIRIQELLVFFEERGKSISRPMIQNYVRLRILPAPLNRFYYTPEHLGILMLIDEFKEEISLADMPFALDFLRQALGKSACEVANMYRRALYSLPETIATAFSEPEPEVPTAAAVAHRLVQNLALSGAFTAECGRLLRKAVHITENASGARRLVVLGEPLGLEITGKDEADGSV